MYRILDTADLDMEIHQLRYFCAVARTGSFTKAATLEHIAQPSLSQQISRLEHDLGTRLFDRLGRGIQLTESGRALLPRALDILRQVNAARTTIESLARNIGGRLAVGCIPTIMPYFLAPKVSGFTASYPEVELHLVEEVTSNLVELLQSGDLDLAVLSPPVNNPDVVCSDLYREPICVAVGRTHRLAGEASVSLPDLQNERMLLLKEGHCFRDNALTICSRARMNFIPIFETNQFSSILPLVAAGLGISLVPEMAVTPDSGCCFLRLERQAYRRIGYMRVRQHAVGSAQKAFINWLRTISKRL